jgi:RNA polymerase sigma-70 factor, ECF subfamily
VTAEPSKSRSNGKDGDDFHAQLLSLLPKLRAYAVSLTHSRDAADDLVQETVAKALRARHSFDPGTNLAAWLFRIQRNQFISEIRAAKPTCDIDSAMSLSLPANQEGAIVMREFRRAFAKLPPTQREALLLSVIDGQRLQDVAVLTGVSEGTVKSRISRGRDALARMMLGKARKPLLHRQGTSKCVAQDVQQASV